MKKELQVHGQLLFIMKVSFVHFLFTLTCISIANASDVTAQVLDKPVTIHLQDISLRTALSKIERLADVKFLYQSNLISPKEKVTLAAQDERLADVLEKMLAARNIGFEAEGNQIILTKRELTLLIDAQAEPPSELPYVIRITGIVTDEQNMPLPGVNILIKGSSTGTTSDNNGKYSIDVAQQNDILVFTFIGYSAQEIVVGTQTEINVQLNPDIQSLEEIVVIGYGEVKKSDLTGAVASIRTEELNAYPVTNVMQSLAGRATGVYISQKTGAPGSEINVRVRGTNSLQGGNEPLYVVDGFPYSGNPTLLNNADIASVEVLKDASATAIYGSRGANGVVLITTKRGKSGRTNVEYDGYYGFQTVRKKIDMMNAREYAEFYNEQAANDGKIPHFTQEEIDAMGEGTDWQDVVLQTAPIQNHAVTLNGGSEKTRFSLSGSNFNQQGIVIKSDYVRNALRANVNTDLSDKFSVDLNAILSRIDSERRNYEGGNRGGSLMSAMLSAYPTVTPYAADGSYTNLRDVYSWGSNAIYNPLNFVNEMNDHIRSNKILANASVTYKPIEGLSIRIAGGVENTDDRVDKYTTKKFLNSQGSAFVETKQITSVLNENTVSYTKQIDDHNISAVTGLTYQENVTTYFNTSGSGFVSDIQESYDLQAATIQGIPASGYSKWVLLSYLARVNYTFKDKYLATVSFRADGSSRYSEGNKWGYFPSASFAWRLSEEQFIKDISIISDLKIRAGYGETGSTAIDPYYTLNALQSNKVVFGDALTTYYAPGTRMPGPLKWETTAQADVGLDVGILENRFSFTIDYYVKNTRDLLNNVPLPSSLGYLYTIQNVGEVQNKGFEFSAGANILTNGPFKWNVQANVSLNKNKVVKLYGGKDVLGEALNIAVVNDNINILREGESIGSFFGYVEKGYDDTGKIIYEDYNGSGGLDIGDKRIIGNPNPKLIFGFNSTMSYKNFELNIFVQGSQGNDLFNLSAVNQTMDYGQALNMPRDVYENHWTPENPTAKYPVIKTSSQPQISSRFVEDGSYMRFKNIQLSYNLPVTTWQLHWLTRAQIYVSGQNLITITDYSWYDPEINSYGGANSIRQGIDHYSYPSSKSMTVGVRLGF